MKLSKVISIVSLGAVACHANIYYQPNGMFAPVSVGIIALTHQQQLAQPVQALPQKAPEANSAWSLSNLFGLGKTSSSKAPITPDAMTTMLAQILAPMRVVTVKFLAGLQARLEKDTPEDMANIIRGPLNEIKNYLASNWPSPNAKSMVLPDATPRLPVPAIRGSSAADLAHK
ncbi:hypothetical protein GGF42_002860 [Coemansia sp. RSA 2424]|nr:hypothetical protein GGF42_002860 [Coemansia sp. RSA 2424]